MSTKAMNHAVASIELAKFEDRRGNAAMRNQIISQLRGDSALPKKTLATMLKNAGLK